jgi:ATP-dependent DNA ligase
MSSALETFHSHALCGILFHLIRKAKNRSSKQFMNPRLDFIEPMLAKLVNKLPQGQNWEYEAK